MVIRLTFLFIFFVVFVFSAEQKILAVINGTNIISSYDLERYKTIVKVINPMYKKSDSQILDEMIDNTLIVNMYYETSKRQPNLPTISSLEIQNILKRLEQQNKYKEGYVVKELKKHGISKHYVYKFAKNVIIIDMLTQQFMQSHLDISNEELYENLELKMRNFQSSKYTLSEIYISFYSHSEDKAKKIINKVYKQLKRGANFYDLAAQKSEAIRIKRFKDTISLYNYQFPDEINAVIDNTPKGKFTKPIKMSDGYRIYLVHDKQAAKGYDMKEKDLMEAQREVQRSYFELHKQKAMSDFLQELRGNAYIEKHQ